MTEMVQDMMSMSNQRLIKIKPFSGNQKDSPKWKLKQRNNVVVADLEHVIGASFVGKLPSSKTMEFSDNTQEYTLWFKHRQQNAKVGAAIVAVQESEDVILGLQESNELAITWPSRVAPNVWKELNRRRLKGANQHPIVTTYGAEVRIWCNIQLVPGSNPPECFRYLDPISKAVDPSFHLVYGSPRTFFF